MPSRQSASPRDAVIRGLGTFAVLGGLLSLLGWVLDVQPLTDWTGDGISIQPNATIAVTSAGTALILVTLRRQRPVAVLGVIVTVLGAAALLQYLTGVRLDAFNTALMFGRTWGHGGVIDPGRMGPPGAVCWTLIGVALVLSSGLMGRGARRAVPYIALVTLAIAALAMTGHLYQATTLYAEPRLTVIAFQTSLFIAAISVGVIATVPQSGPMRLLRDEGTAGFIARRAAPVVIMLAFGIGLLRLHAQTTGWLTTTAATAARTIVEMVLLLGLLWWALAAIRRHEAALIENRRRKDEFLAVLAHELRGPLAPLRNSLEFIKRMSSDPTLHQARETMDRQLHHLVRLVDDLVDVSRITHDKIELRKSRVDVGAILREALDAAVPALEGARLQLRVALPPEPLYVIADPVRLTQIFNNILSNARRYTPAGGEVRVSARRDGNSAVVQIADTGMGLPPDKLHYIFEMFTQIDSAERPLGGLGVGLALVRRLVELHGGQVSAHSDGPGRGSEFIVRFPAVADRPSGGRPASGAEPPPTDETGRRILVVDDNVDAATSLALLLRMSGAETEVAHDGVAALETAERMRPDVILLDIGLPKLDGLAVCRRIREEPWGQRVTLVALSGLGQDDDRRKSKQAGFDRHLVKPVDFAALQRLLAEARAVSA